MIYAGDVGQAVAGDDSAELPEGAAVVTHFYEVSNAEVMTFPLGKGSISLVTELSDH